VKDLPEPEIVAFGRGFNFPEIDYRLSLKKAFVDRRVSYIVLDSIMTNNRFRAACVAWAIDAGFLKHIRDDDDGQCKVSAFALTDAGKEEFLSKVVA
jgi:hypothetical protein